MEENFFKNRLKLPNKHEKLFPLSSPLFTIKCINFFMITLTMWLIVGISTIPKSLKKEELVEIYVFWFAIFLIFLCYFIWIPFMLKRLSIVTKVINYFLHALKFNYFNKDRNAKRPKNNPRRRFFLS